MAELLLELFSEEIPARMQKRACEDLKRLMDAELTEARLEYSDMRAYSTPRRLTLVVGGLPKKQPDLTEERRGPRADAPEKAIEGFKGSLPEGARIEEREEKKGTFLYATIEQEGLPTADVVTGLVGDIVWEFPWPKSMRWGDFDLRWVRPLWNILCVFDGRAIPVDLQRGIGRAEIGKDFRVGGAKVPEFKDTAETYGHHLHAPEPLEVKDFAHYAEKLRNAYVILDPAERMKIIREKSKSLAAEAGLDLVEDEALLAENAGLTEWPVPLLGTFDEGFLEVPPEVLAATMKTNQKYFNLRHSDGSMANKFICVANLDADDGGKAIIRGNERVLDARLSDAKFFWDQDRKADMEADWMPHLAEVVFHEKLGTLADKAERMAALARYLAPFTGADADKAERAARLAKTDLVSGMVGEFPEVQGIMGGYYAREAGEDPAVAQAIADHYRPQGPGDDCPSAPESVAVALADKIDTLVGFFGIDEKPTGSKDPYALRRAALGAIRLIVENGVRIGLRPVLNEAVGYVWQSLFMVLGDFPVTPLSDELEVRDDGDFQTFVYRGEEIATLPTPTDVQNVVATHIIESQSKICSALLDFFADRLKVQQREKGVRHDLIDAVFALTGEDDLVRLLARVDALRKFLDTDDGANLLAGYRRAANIVRIEEKNDNRRYDGDVDYHLLQEAPEKDLYEKLGAAKGEAKAATEIEDFADAMRALAKLRAPVDAFFDHVTVNTDDPALRENRLNLLNDIRAAVHTVADFSKIEG